MSVFEFSTKREDHIVQCSCGEEHEIIHKIAWSDENRGLIIHNFWICLAAGETHYLDENNKETTCRKFVSKQNRVVNDITWIQDDAA